MLWHGDVNLLTRHGFGLASAPKIMTAIVEWILAADATTETAVSSYIDDLFVVQDRVSVETVRDHLRIWGLESKALEWLGAKSGVRVLGLCVDEQLRWCRDKQLPDIGDQP